jgi:hypothetical protein
VRLGIVVKEKDVCHVPVRASCTDVLCSLFNVYLYEKITALVFWDKEGIKSERQKCVENGGDCEKISS